MMVAVTSCPMADKMAELEENYDRTVLIQPSPEKCFKQRIKSPKQSEMA